jgi:hypothetical protein
MISEACITKSGVRDAERLLLQAIDLFGRGEENNRLLAAAFGNLAASLPRPGTFYGVAVSAFNGSDCELKFGDGAHSYYRH